MAKYYVAKDGVITIDDSVKPTAADKFDVETYVKSGYIIRHKSKKRSKVAAERAKENNLSDKDIQAALKNDKEALANYTAIKKKTGKGGGFWAAKSWYIKNYNK